MQEAGCIYIECALCRESVESPELLCEHMSEQHASDVYVRSITFEQRSQFQSWLSSVESSRASQSGLVASTSEDISDSTDGEYYLLCSRSPSPPTKRRRRGSLHQDSINNYAVDDAISTVTCTAFVHVNESAEFGISVRYCLEHCAHSPATERRRRPHTNTRSELKRSSSFIGLDDDDDSMSMPSSPSSDAETTSSIDSTDASINTLSVGCDASPLTSEPPTNARKYGQIGFHSRPSPSQNFTSVDSVINGLADFDLSSVNSQISQRLDSTADRLKALTKVLADLAVDIRKQSCEENLRHGCRVSV